MKKHEGWDDISREGVGLALRGLYMTRDGKVALTAEQLNAKGVGQRMMEVGTIDVDARTVELAFSSEYEGERWFGIEVLDHTPGAAKLERLRDAGACLVNHDWDDQVGVIVSASIDGDHVGRAKVRFGNSPRAQEIFQDIVDGIRKHVSVGYRLLEAKLRETRDNGTDVYLITSWEPYEISIVPVPFDHSVGIGRSAEIPPEEKPQLNPENSPNNSQTRSTPEVQPTMNEKILRDAAGNLVRAQVNEAGEIVKVLEMIERAGEAQAQAGTNAATAERKRAADILKMGDTYGCADQARKAVDDGISVEAFTRTALDALNTRAAAPAAPAGSGKRSGAGAVTDDKAPKSADIGMSEADVRKYSLFKVIRALANPGDARAQEDAAFEIECGREQARVLDKEARGIMVPQDVLGRAFNAGGAANTPTGAQTGSNLVATDYMGSSFIEMLRNRTTIMKLARTMGGLVGNIEIPKQIGGATAYWIGEHEDATEGTPVIGQIELSPKTVAAYTDISRKLLKQSTPDAESIVRGDLLAAMSLAIDYAGYYGTGTGNEPRGIKNYSGINAVDFAAVQPSFAELVAMESAIAADNADVNSMAYVLNAIGRGAAKTTQKFTGGGDTGTIWETGGTLNGYRTEVTNQVATGDVFFGNFADLIVALWGGLDLIADPYSLSKKGALRIVVFQDVDFAVRRVESFAYGSATVTP